MANTKYMNGTDDCGYMVTRLTIADLDAIEPHEAEYFGIAMCTCGTARITINLDVHDMCPNDVAIFSPKDMVHSKAMSEDFCLKVIYITRLEILREAAAQVLPFVMDSSASRTFFTEEQQEVASSFHAVYTFLETLLADKQTVSKYEQGVCVFRCLLLGIRDKSTRYREPQRKIEPGNSMGHYNHFMVLLNQYSKVHHDVAFYACQLHITSQYLGRICRKYDGRGPKEIIDDMLLLQLKSTLKHTEKTMKEICYEYNFSNLSFMCSFFRRNVGITPSEFRAKYRGGTQL